MSHEEMKVTGKLKKTVVLFIWILVFHAHGMTQKLPDRVEPPFWWVNMNHNELQIKVYGEKIGFTQVMIDHPGVRIREVVSVESLNYLFIYLDIKDAVPGKFTIRFHNDNDVVFAHDYELKERQSHSKYLEGFDASDAIYLLMPDRFANGNPDLDNLPHMLEKVDRNNPDARQGGDIQGVINHLDHIANMGFTAIWINPLLENNQPLYSYHGYAITDFYRIDARYGSNEDYRTLVSEARKKGLKIIKDMVLNHCGHYHWWIDDLPTQDWIHQWPEFTRVAYSLTTLADPYFAESDFVRYNQGWFDTNMPDLNQQNRLLADYLIQNSIWWIEYAKLGGIRLDTQPFADKDFVSQWAYRIMSEYPDFNIAGEQWSFLVPFSAYFQGGNEQYDGYNSNIPAAFDFPLFEAIGQAFNEEHGWNSGMGRLYNILAQDFLYADPYQLIIFGDNHDTDRILTRMGNNIENLKLAMAFLATTRGIPQFYSGFETLESAFEHDGHGILRTRFPGGWPDDERNAFTREGRTEQENSVVDYLSRLLNYRKSKTVLHLGKLKHFVPENNVYVYFRYDDNDTLMIVLNNNEESEVLNLSRFDEVTGDFSKGVNIMSEKVFILDKELLLPAKTALILELK
jgi:neopullulanase